MQVVSVDDAKKKATIKLVPRIDLHAVAEKFVMNFTFKIFVLSAIIIVLYPLSYFYRQSAMKIYEATSNTLSVEIGTPSADFLSDESSKYDHAFITTYFCVCCKFTCKTNCMTYEYQ